MKYQLPREADITSGNMVALTSVQASNSGIPARFKETCTDTTELFVGIFRYYLQLY